jgi:hypothetical protein
MSLHKHVKAAGAALRQRTIGGAPQQFGPRARQDNDAWAMGIDVFGRPYFIGRGEYAQQQNAQMPGTLWAMTGQLNLASGGEYWGYSYGEPTIGTDWDTVSGNPPHGGFSQPVLITSSSQDF